MSLYFDLVINCYFREEISEEHVKVLHWLTDKDYELDFTPTLTVNYEGYDAADVWESVRLAPHMLASHSERQIISQLRRIHYTTIPLENNREAYLWLLQYIGRWLHDDGFYECYLPCVYWLASIAKDGLVGYWRETDYAFTKTYLLFAKNTSVQSVDVDSQFSLLIQYCKLSFVICH
ncbi:MAG: hypothetical protein L0154_21570 [Chloroflexi bacterium]|nr:hypothetical protein [Chloroflexota bacterium]